MSETSLISRFKDFFARSTSLELANRLEEMDNTVCKFIESRPQRDENGEIRHLIISGCAAGLQTGWRKEHNDLDILDFRLHVLRYTTRTPLLGVDYVRPDSLHGGMRLDPEFLKDTALPVHVPKHDLIVLTVCPAVILVGKMANDEVIEDDCNDRWESLRPRLRDIYDSVAILKSEHAVQPHWDVQVATALLGLGSCNRETATKWIELLQRTIHGLDFPHAFLEVANVWNEPIDPYGDLPNFNLEDIY